MGIAAAVVAVGVVGAAASVYAGSQQSSAIKSAANTQANADLQAQQIQKNEFDQTQTNLQPFVNQGTQAFNQLGALTGVGPGGNPLTAALTKPFTPGDLSQTPGYQFTLGQGLQATQNSYAAQGLGSSGAAMKGAANYAEGLAGTTYNQQLQNYLAQNAQIYNMLSGEANTGESAGAQLGSLGQQNANAQGQAVAGAGAAQAAGTVGAAQAQTQGVTGAVNSISQGALGYALTQGTGANNNGLYAAPPPNNVGSNPNALLG